MSKKSALRKANNDTIKNAFARLIASKDEKITAAMYGMLEDAVQIALEIHENDPRHHNHLVIGDTYGWMLVHNHRIQEIMVVSTEDNEGKATDQLRAYLKELPEKGWAGVVMAGMETMDGFTYFSYRFERIVLEQTARITKENFFQYFTKA